MRPFTSTIDFDEALRRVLAAAAPVARTEELPLLEADGRVAAVTSSSAIDVPAFDRAAMDGYAVIAADTAAGSNGGAGDADGRRPPLQRADVAGIRSRAARAWKLRRARQCPPARTRS